MTKKPKEKRKLGRLRSFFTEFKTFAVRGNMIDMAVGLIVGGAFTALVNSIVSNIATPLIGILMGVDFSGWTVTLPRLYGEAEPGTMAIGAFLNGLVSFVIVAFVVFLFVKAINRFRGSDNKPPPKPSREEELLAEIRDILREQRKS